MIVRIMGEGQFKLPGSYLDQLNEIDNSLVRVVGRGDRSAFKKLFDEMLALVRKHGRPLAVDELMESDIILPPHDTTLEEAQGLFTGQGLIPG